MSGYDDYLDKILAKAPETMQHKRGAAWVRQDRWSKAEAAARDNGPVLVRVRCPEPHRQTIAKVYASKAGPLFVAAIKRDRTDQLERHRPPWEREELLRTLPEEILSDDERLLWAASDQQPPKRRGDHLDKSMQVWLVLDLLEPPPAPDLDTTIALWVRCPDHPRKVARQMKRMSNIGYMLRHHPAGGTAVSRPALVVVARKAMTERKVQDYFVPAPSPP